MLHINFPDGPLKNFWRENPHFRHPEPFAELHSSDKSKSKNFSSNVMWFLTFFCHQHSPYRYLHESDRYVRIGDDLFSDPSFYQKTRERPLLKKLIPVFYDFCETPAERLLRVYNKKLNQRVLFLDELEYSPETASMLDDLASKSSKMIAEYDQARKLVENQEEVNIKGDSMLSLSEQGRI